MDRKFLREYAIFLVVVTLFMIASALLFSQIITKTDSNQPLFPQKCYVLDAGHGGEDGGAVSISGIPESQYNLQIATTVNDLLQLLGYQTYMIRTDDRDLHTEGTTISQRKISDLKHRVKIANQIPNAVLISIHQNKFTDPRYSGLQTFYFNSASKELAESIQSSYKAHILPTSRRLAQRKSGVYLLENVHCTAVLVECGFLSNYEEEKLLGEHAYRLKLACAIILPLLAEP